MKGSVARVIGFDCAEDEHVAVLLDDAGEQEQLLTMRNRLDRIEECLAKLMLEVEDELVVVVESKRAHGQLVVAAARKLGCRVVQVNTVALNHFRELEGQPRKDDEWDAFLAARMCFLRMRGCRELVEVTEEERALSRLTRTHLRLTRDRTRHVSRLRAVLLELAPEVLHSSWEGPKLDSRAMTYILKRWPGFEGLERAQMRSLEKILHQCRYGHRTEDVARLVREMARRISMDPEERAAVTLELDSVLGQVAACDTSLKRLNSEIERRVARHPVGPKLLEMHGIGPIIAGVLLSELLPVARNATEARSATYSGVTPLGRKSGKSLNTAHLTQGVNKRILHALYTSSVVAIQHSAIDRAYYTKKIQDYAGHPKPHVAAFIALSRQRHKVIFRLMTTDARYNKETLIARHLERLAANQGTAA